MDITPISQRRELNVKDISDLPKVTQLGLESEAHSQVPSLPFSMEYHSGRTMRKDMGAWEILLIRPRKSDLEECSEMTEFNSLILQMQK